ncbi:MAG TPA: hypothetical protein ENG51_14660 [Deltaproteobacteria bacterium]|nr:hypothetical protein [Deltaproteobacteria bacterium]
MKLKFLADVNIEKEIIKTIGQMGYEISPIADIDIYMKDRDVLELANKTNAILLTNDKDFGELVFRQKLVSTGIILFRIKGEETNLKALLIRKLLMGYQEKVAKHFTVITRKKFRFIPL